MISKLDRENKLYKTLFNDFIRISIDRNNSASIRGHPTTQEYSYIRKGNPDRMCSVISLPIHSLTHFDIAQNISLNDANNYFLPQFFERIAVINLCHKKDIVKDYLLQEKDTLFDDVIYPFLNMERFKKDSQEEDSTILFNLLNNLQINENDLTNAFKGRNLKDFDGIILRTDWSDFRYGNPELNNPFLEMFHAFLVHPHINLNTLYFIKKQNPDIKLIGSDTPTLANPASFVDPNHTFPTIRKVYFKMHNEGIIMKNVDIAEAFLENKHRYFIKNVGRLNCVQKEKETITVGSMMLIPIPLLSEPTGMVCELYFKREHGGGSI